MAHTCVWWWRRDGIVSECLSTKGESNFTVKKPGRHHPNQMIKRMTWTPSVMRWAKFFHRPPDGVAGEECSVASVAFLNLIRRKHQTHPPTQGPCTACLPWNPQQSPGYWSPGEWLTEGRRETSAAVCGSELFSFNERHVVTLTDCGSCIVVI